MKHGTVKGHQRAYLVRGGLVEWRTLAIIVGCHAVWIGAGTLYMTAWWLSLPILSIAIVLHSSLQHEVVHRHPTLHAELNEALVSLPLGLLVPFRRYRDTHLAHHRDSRLTDPYDDPESFYLAVYDHERLPRVLRVLLRWNNMLLVRMLIGPVISTIGFLLTEVRAMIGCERRTLLHAWGLHGLGVIAIGAIVHFSFAMPLWAYLGAVYLSLSILAVRSFCEHRWADAPDARTVIIERSLLGFLFLNNNLHLVHHKMPGLPWYFLPAAYRAQRAQWQALNRGYVFRNYMAVMRAYGLRQKEPVVHPEAN